MKSSLGGEVYVLGEMVGHMSFLRDFRAPFEGSGPGTGGCEDCKSLFARPKTRNIAEKCSARQFLSIQQALEQGELDNVYWLPGTENPADGLTRAPRDFAPLLADAGIWSV